MSNTHNSHHPDQDTKDKISHHSLFRNSFILLKVVLGLPGASNSIIQDLLVGMHRALLVVGLIE